MSETKKAVAPSSPTKKTWAAIEREPRQPAGYGHRLIEAGHAGPRARRKPPLRAIPTAPAVRAVPPAAKKTPGRYRIVAIAAIHQIARFVRRPLTAAHHARSASLAARPRTTTSTTIAATTNSSASAGTSVATRSSRPS